MRLLLILTKCGAVCKKHWFPWIPLNDQLELDLRRLQKRGFALLHVYPYRSFLHKNGRTRFGSYLATELLWAKIFSAAGFAKNVIKSQLVLQILRHCIIKKVVIDSRQNGNLYKKMIPPLPTSESFILSFVLKSWGEFF